ncbi:hypothetical protein [Streptomyces jumonjinensis]|uniref:hypothetical protein n=1 Tax=Streptomyces jumonjinensis TaxID=1945 RepID=UPI0037B8A362
MENPVSEHRIVVGIDVGTHASGFAWCVVDPQNDDASQRKPHFCMQWESQPMTLPKNLSALLLNEEGETAAWGYEARRRALAQHGSDQTHQYRAAFKMDLMAPSGQQNETDAEEPLSGAQRAGEDR